MTTTNNNMYQTNTQDVESLIASLKAEVELDPSDLVNKISLATVLEQSDRIGEARAVYQEIVDADPVGSMGAIASKALEALKSPESIFLEPEPNLQSAHISNFQLPQSEGQKAPLPVISSVKKSPLQWFYNLPISRKQVIALLASELVSVIALGLGVRYIIETGLRSQLLNQAKSEVAVTEINYNIKVNQMGFGFRGQSDNSAVINAAKAQSENKPIPAALQSQVKKILANEVKARKIEYATLVGKDLRIIVNANNNRQGEVFNPNNLVKQVFNDQRQIKASAIVDWNELKKE